MFCPSKKFICFSFVLFLAGGSAFVGLNAIFAYTNTNEFCISCHSMRINYEEYKETLHYKNSAGIKADCADCHVPKEFFPKLYAKIVAVKDVYHEVLGTVDTIEKFEARRWDMANRVWQKMRMTDSRECRTCHDYSDMDMSEQDRLARKKHTRAPLEGKTCIDCHTGLTHTEPLEPDEKTE